MVLAPEVTSMSCADVMITLPVMLPVMLPVTLPVTLPITLSHTLTWSVSGSYLHHKTSIPGERIPLYFDCSPDQPKVTRSAIFVCIVENQILTMETPCCGHTSHCRSFQKWVVVQSIGKCTIADSDASIQNGGAR